MFYSAKRFLLLTSFVLSWVAISAQTNKPKVEKTTKQFQRPGVDNQNRLDSIKNILDQQRLIKRKVNNTNKKK